MVQPTVTVPNYLSPLQIQEFQRYLPSAFDDSLTMLEKVNKLIEFCNQTGITVNSLIDQWKAITDYVDGDGLTNAVDNQLTTWKNDGTFNSIINQNIFDGLNKKINDFIGVDISADPYNAQPNTDITSILQQAIDDLPQIGLSPLGLPVKNGCIYIPSGKFQVSNVTIPMGVSIVGQTPVSTPANTIRNVGTIIDVITTNGSCFKFIGESLRGSGCSIRNIIFTGGKGDNTTTLELTNIFYMSIINCSFIHLDVSDALLGSVNTTYGSSCNWIIVRDCLFKIIGSQNIGNQYYTYGNGINFNSVSDSHIINTQVESCGQDGMVFGSGNNKVTTCWSDLCRYGANVITGDQTFTDCHFNHNQREGIALQGTSGRLTINNSWIYDNGNDTSASYSGIKWGAGSLILSSCYVGSEGDNQDSALYIGSSIETGTIIGNVLVSGASGAISDPYALLLTSKIKTDANIGFNENKGGSIQKVLTSDGTKTQWFIPHNLGAVPSKIAVTAGSPTATGRNDSERFYINADATNLIITFNSPPINGANPTINWIAEL